MFLNATEQAMKHAKKLIVATSAFLCATPISFSWSDHNSVSLSVASAQARVGRPATPVSVAGAARRTARRGVGVGLAGAAAVGTAAAIGSAYNGYYGDDSYYSGAGYGYDAGPYGAYAAVPYGGYGAYGYGSFNCAPWPRVGAYASQPWSDSPTCPPY
jgi:hypothetical protein